MSNKNLAIGGVIATGAAIVIGAYLNGQKQKIVTHPGGGIVTTPPTTPGVQIIITPVGSSKVSIRKLITTDYADNIFAMRRRGIMRGMSAAQTLIAGTSYNISGTVSGGVAPYTYSWTFGDGGTSTGASNKYSYKNTGNYNLSVVVTDSLGQTSTGSASITVIVPLTIVSLEPKYPTSEVGISNTYTLVVSGGATPYTYNWSFGDGTTGTGSNPTHVFQTAGTFIVNVTVTDANGTTTNVSTVQTVNPALNVSVGTSALGAKLEQMSAKGIKTVK